MSLFRLAFAGLLVTATAALADSYVPVTDRARFVELVGARELRHPVFGIRLEVTADGEIHGSALGWPVLGNWYWKDGYFCREIDWSGTLIPLNCQLVEVMDDRKLRFTVDKGAGDAATFRLQ